MCAPMSVSHSACVYDMFMLVHMHTSTHAHVTYCGMCLGVTLKTEAH